MRQRPIRQHTCPVVGDPYFTDPIVDSNQKTFRCIVLAVDRENHSAFVAWDESAKFIAGCSWIPCDDLRVQR